MRPTAIKTKPQARAFDNLFRLREAQSGDIGDCFWTAREIGSHWNTLNYLIREDIVWSYRRVINNKYTRVYGLKEIVISNTTRTFPCMT